MLWRWEKVADYEELMGCLRGEPVIFARSNKDFKLFGRKTCMERNNLCAGICTSTNKVNTIKTNFMKQSRSI